VVFDTSLLSIEVDCLEWFVHDGKLRASSTLAGANRFTIITLAVAVALLVTNSHHDWRAWCILTICFFSFNFSQQPGRPLSFGIELFAVEQLFTRLVDLFAARPTSQAVR